VSVGQRSSRIDLLRGVSILLVLLHHFNIAYSLRDAALSRWLAWGVVHAVVRNGNYAVTMFFAISGFLITGNALRHWGSLASVDAGRFYALRAARILPCVVLLVAVVSMLGLSGAAMFQNRPEQGPPVSFWVVDLAALTFWMNLLMARAGWVNYVLCVLWSLSVEEVFCLVFPVICRVLRREAWVAACLALPVLAGPLWRLAHQDDEAGFLYAYLACFDAIAIGCWAALLAARMRRLGADAASGRGGAGARRGVRDAVAVAAMAVLYLGWPISDTNVFGVTVVALGTAVLLLGADRSTVGPIGGVAGAAAGAAASAAGGIVRWFGRRNYELYLFHLVVLGLLRSVAPPGTASSGGLLFLTAYLGGSALLAEGVARIWSEPANRAIRRRLVRPGMMAA
jgi:peptidoglycan/LPS O-acetylase OafA/YrhL